MEASALRPLEWYRLAATHGRFAEYIHDGVYDDDGVAEQNDIPVKQAKLFPVPRLQMVGEDLDALLDFALTRTELAEEVAAVLKAHPREAVLTALSRLISNRRNDWAEQRCYEIAARVLGPFAGEWVTARWQDGTRKATIFAFFEAVARCLPQGDRVEKAIAAIERMEPQDRAATASALIVFHSSLVLDWLENEVRPPVLEKWGWIAARSDFSWGRAIKWLEAGRPLSLVALDALVDILAPPPGRRRQAPLLLPDMPSPELLLDRLNVYALVDPVPRVSRAVAAISESIDTRSSGTT